VILVGINVRLLRLDVDLRDLKRITLTSMFYFDHVVGLERVENSAGVLRCH
jgi:hypothetical protein